MKTRHGSESMNTGLVAATTLTSLPLRPRWHQQRSPLTLRTHSGATVASTAVSPHITDPLWGRGGINSGLPSHYGPAQGPRWHQQRSPLTLRTRSGATVASTAVSAHIKDPLRGHGGHQQRSPLHITDQSNCVFNWQHVQLQRFTNLDSLAGKGSHLTQF